MSEPRYLLQTEDGVLHTYWDRIILLIHLAENPGIPVKLYRHRTGSMGRTKYEPCTAHDLRNEQTEYKLEVIS